MLKQLSYALAAAALMGTTLASCSSDEPGLINADGNVTFSVQLPADMATRADNTGTGLSATRLTAAVYQTVNNTTTCVDTKTATFANLTSQVEFQLVKGATYKIVFFADAQTNSPYAFDTNTGTMSVTYLDSYAETNDCFYKAIDVTVNAGYTGGAVTLTRPVAQLNLGTNDLTQALAAGVYPNGVTVKSTVKNVANSLNLLTGEATGTVNAESTATMNDTYSGLNFPYDPTTYKYLAMGYYLLPGQVSGTTTSGTYDCEFQLMNGTTNVGSPIISSATPMQANYRTNIYGALLTKGVIYDVTIEPAFGATDNNVPIWDGTAKAPTIPAGNATPIVINEPAELAAIAQMVNGTMPLPTGVTSLDGYTIQLAADMDFGGRPWTCIGTTDKPFNGTIDGQNHNITNLTAPVVGYMTKGTIKDINVKHSNIENTGDAGAVLAKAKNQADTDPITISGINVAQDVTITAHNYYKPGSTTPDGGSAAGIAGYINTKKLSFSNCTVAATINGQKAAGIVAHAKGDVTINNCVVTSDASCTGTQFAAGIIGFGYNVNELTITGCSTAAALSVPTVKASPDAVGGIVAYVAHGSEFNVAPMLTITGCTVTGSITGRQNLGAIIGKNQDFTAAQMNVTGNTDTGVTITTIQ